MQTPVFCNPHRGSSRVSDASTYSLLPQRLHEDSWHCSLFLFFQIYHVSDGTNSRYLNILNPFCEACRTEAAHWRGVPFKQEAITGESPVNIWKPRNLHRAWGLRYPVTGGRLLSGGWGMCSPSVRLGAVLTIGSWGCVHPSGGWGLCSLGAVAVFTIRRLWLKLAANNLVCWNFYVPYLLTKLS